MISIHALREEGDGGPRRASRLRRDFYPRPPRGGRRGVECPDDGVFLFLSTPSARRATPERRCAIAGWLISIHALREEGDYLSQYYRAKERQFLSTPSARRATRHGALGQPRDEISIHALREEGDPFGYRRVKLKNDFYPRPPRGGRRLCRLRRRPTMSISIHALREEGDVAARSSRLRQRGISIHALREEGDRTIVSPSSRSTYFYPRPPCQ